jgi:hypothetical protein
MSHCCPTLGVDVSHCGSRVQSTTSVYTQTHTCTLDGEHPWHQEPNLTYNVLLLSAKLNLKSSLFRLYNSSDTLFIRYSDAHCQSSRRACIFTHTEKCHSNRCNQSSALNSVSLSNPLYRSMKVCLTPAASCKCIYFTPSEIQCTVTVLSHRVVNARAPHVCSPTRPHLNASNNVAFQ